MTPDLIFFAIRGLLRVGSAARDAYEQSVRDAQFSMPPPPQVTLDALDVAITYFKPGGSYETLVKKGGPLFDFWDADHQPGPCWRDTPEARAAMIDAVLGIHRSHMALQPPVANDLRVDWITVEGGAGIPLDQWATGAAPPEPWVRIAMALAGVALDFVGSNPGLLVSGGNGEKLISALALNLEKLLPDPNVKDQASFVERLAVVALQAGLESITQNPGLVFDHQHLQALLLAITDPLVKQFAATNTSDVLAHFSWMQIRDDLLPKMVQAGIEIVAENQKAFLGKEFDPTKSTGSLTQAFLVAVQTGKLRALGNAEGWIPVYRTLLQAVAARSDVIVKGSAADTEFYRGLLENVANAALAMPMPFDDSWKVRMAAAALQTLHDYLPFRTATPWTDLAGDAIQQMADGLSQALKTGNPLDQVFTQEELMELLRLLLQKAAVTPGMLTGRAKNKELQTLVSVVAAAMAADKDLLISADGWKTIAAVIGEEAARNPGRLFGLGDPPAVPEKQLAVNLISQMVVTAEQSLRKAGGRSGGAVLLGGTLVDAIVETLKVAAGNVDRASCNLGALDTLIMRLNDLATAPTDRIGATEWLWLFRKMVAQVIETGSVEASADDLRRMLYQGREVGL